MSEDSPKDGPLIGTQIRRGARSSIMAQLSVQLGSALATILLARLLSPAEFGIIALAQSLLGMASLVSLAGITAALVTYSGDVRRKAATYFWLALSIGALLAAAISILSGSLVTVLGQPGAAAFVVVLSLSLPLSLLTLIPQALLQRRLQFHRMNTVTVAGALVYFAFEVIFAFLGWGPWAVIWGQVVGSGTSLVLALILARWLPAAKPQFGHVREDLGLISNMGIGAFLGYLGKNADYWAVSGILGAGPLGIYYIAYVLPSIIRIRLSGIFRQILLPVVVRLHDLDEQAAAWAKACRAMLTLALPMMFGIAAISDPLVTLLFGARWGEAALPMRIITLAGLADLMIHAVSTLAIARRKHVTRSTAIIGLRALLIGAGAALAGVFWGTLTAVSLAVLIASIITIVVQEFWLARPLGVGWRVLGSQPFAVLLLSVTMGAVVDGFIRVLPDDFHFLWQLLGGVLIGLLSYTALGWLFARSTMRESSRQLARLVRGS